MAGAEGATAPETLRQRTARRDALESRPAGISPLEKEYSARRRDNTLRLQRQRGFAAHGWRNSPRAARSRSCPRRPEIPPTHPALRSARCARRAMVPFAGYEMPVQYPARHPRRAPADARAAGLFDVSHMGQIALLAEFGHVDDAARRSSGWCRGDILGLAPGRQRYALFTNDDGGILDDLMVRATSATTCSWSSTPPARTTTTPCEAPLPTTCVHRAARPRAARAAGAEGRERAGAHCAGGGEHHLYGRATRASSTASDCFVSRSGYTGEDGFEISVPAE